MDAEVVKVARELREFAKAGLRDSGPRPRMELLKRVPSLRGLAPIQAAGEDSKAQYEYLVQAITDAVDSIGQAVVSVAAVPPSPAASATAREAKALRALFGLTAQGRWRSWRERQGDAADAISVSWDHFRHGIQENLLHSVAEQMLDAVRQDYRPSILDGKPGLSAFATQNDVEQQTIDYINRERPRRATMLEFSTATTGSILRALRDVDADIYLLAANPEKRSGWHEARMRHALNNLVNVEFAAYDRLRVRLYSVPPALRGRRIGDLVTLGWYSYRDNKRLDQFDPASVEIWGHDNAIIVGRCSETDGSLLGTWFSREFERLWTHRSTFDESTSAGIIRMPE